MRELAYLIDFMIEQGILWVLSRRDEYRNGARDLSEMENAELSLFFGVSVLDITKVRTVPFIKNPDFYKRVQDINGQILLDFNTAVGMTFNDTIAVCTKYLGAGLPPVSLLFHELVHVVQYQILGVEGFVASYVRGWVENGFDYDSIPLEIQAFELQRRYEKNRADAFSVSAELLGGLKGG